MPALEVLITIKVAALTKNPKDGLLFQYSSAPSQISVKSNGDIDFLGYTGPIKLVYQLDNTDRLPWTEEIDDGASLTKEFYSTPLSSTQNKAIEIFEDQGKTQGSTHFTIPPLSSPVKMGVYSPNRNNATYYYSIHIQVNGVSRYPKFTHDPQIINRGNHLANPREAILRIMGPTVWFIVGAWVTYEIVTKMIANGMLG